MHDYFSEFLLRKNPVGAFASWFGDGTPDATAANPSTLPVAPSCGSNLKLQLVWAALTIATIYITFKISKWYAGYEIAKQQNTSNVQSTLLAKSA